jgi:hypothetical protein
MIALVVRLVTDDTNGGAVMTTLTRDGGAENRIKLLEPVAEGKPATEPKRKGAKRKQAPKPAAGPTANPAVVRWATFGVIFMAVLSALLNGYANAQHSPVTVFGWLMGLAVPLIVLTLAKVCGEKYRAGQKPVAWLAGGSGAALLFLSVWHCSQAIALITGSPVALAMPLAVAIDCGLVACEVALVTEARD